MSKLSIIERNKKRMKMYNKFKAKRNKLLKIANNKKINPDEQFKARLQLSKIPRNASKVRIRNRCTLTGRSRGVYRKFKLSRIAFRELAAIGQIPGSTTIPFIEMKARIVPKWPKCCFLVGFQTIFIVSV